MSAPQDGMTVGRRVTARGKLAELCKAGDLGTVTELEWTARGRVVFVLFDGHRWPTGFGPDAQGFLLAV